MFARETSEVVKTRVVAQCRDGDFERLLRSTFGADAKIELTVAAGAFAETVRKLDTNGATVVIVDVDPAGEADLAALHALTQRIAGTPVIVAIPSFDVAVARQLLQMRVADFVVKPVAPLDLVRARARAALPSPPRPPPPPGPPRPRPPRRPRRTARARPRRRSIPSCLRPGASG